MFSLSAFFCVFLFYLKPTQDQLSSYNLADQAQLLTDHFCNLPLAFCLALEGYGIRLVPVHTPAGNAPAGGILSSEELCCNIVPYPPPIAWYAVLKMRSFLVNSTENIRKNFYLSPGRKQGKGLRKQHIQN